ncbi:MAG: MFS transporter [Pseudomonadales bacterium]|jgi:ACS family tartrate transporter-like MFS transporter|nr:MFS transporter [Pseudomonadales bacterium]
MNDADLYRKVRWRLLPYLLLLYVVAWFDRVNIGFAALQMNAQLEFSAEVYGFGAGIFFIGYALFEVPSNLILAKVGARLWIGRIMVTWGILSVAMMFTQGPLSFYVLRFLLGIAEAGFLPGILFYLGAWFPRAERARAVSWFMMAIPLSTVFGGPIAGLLLGLDGWHGLRGWQWLFVLEGIPAILLGITTWLWLPNAPHEAKFLSAAQAQRIEQRIASEDASSAQRPKADLRGALTMPTVWLLALVLFACQCGSYGLTLWIPQIVRGISGAGDLTVGFISALPYIAAAWAMLAVGASSDRSGERFLHVAVPSFIGAAGFAASAFLLTPVPGMIALTVAAMGDLSTRGPFWALPPRLLSGSALAAGIALINTMASLGGFVGPYAVGYLRDLSGGFTMPLMMLAGLLVLAGALTLQLRREPLLRGVD